MSYLETTPFYELGHNIHNLTTRAMISKQSAVKKRLLVEAQAVLKSMQVKLDGLLEEIKDQIIAQ